MARTTGAARELPKNIGRYEIVRQIGIGAMGRVLLARDPVLGRHVAIKVLRDDLAIASDVQDSLIVRMRHEARAAARVTHPNLVIIHDMGEDEELGLFLVFEYIEGQTLKQRISEGRLSSRQSARIAREIGAALTFAHEHGVLHRDVKPENIILSPTGTKLTDFGIARVPDSTLTHAGGLLGTPAYSAPETFRDGRFSAESDQFSLAATLYEAIRGARAYPGDDAVSVASKIANDGPEPFAEGLRYPPELDDILARGMAKDPSQRFDTCKTLGTLVMEALLAKSATPAKSVEAPPSSRSDESMLPRLSIMPDRPSDTSPSDRRGWRVFGMGLAALIVLGMGLRALLKTSVEGTASASAATSAPVEAPSSVEPEGTATALPPPNHRPHRRSPRTSSPISTASTTPSVETSADASPTGSASAGAASSAPKSSASAGAASSAPKSSPPKGSASTGTILPRAPASASRPK